MIKSIYPSLSARSKLVSLQSPTHQAAVPAASRGCVPATGASSGQKASGAGKRSERSTRPSSRSAPFTATASEDGSCIFCLESSEGVIESGCACRGDAGLAHVQCRILAAEHKQKSTGGAWLLFICLRADSCCDCEDG